MFFLPKNLDEYIVSHSQEEPVLLQDLTRETYQKVLQPIMLSGAYQGRVLSMISQLVTPKRVLEIGTFTGYSALCLAEGMPNGAELITIDINEELEELTSSYFEKYNRELESTGKGPIHFSQLIGDATEIIPGLEGSFDLVFIDADKPNYITYFHQIMEKVHAGSLIISDNVLWHGKVVEPVQKKDSSTPVLLEYNRLLKEDPRLQTVLLSVRDGLTLSRVI
ncbi:O-methyltransferase [Nonlabens xiamenensis]|uniref:O-methyltransferase n=1 Tax=Nonlabens xiamenensis TaxID=2341043 RepID=UPI000F608330|nr:O-methyltransferase [Nonlabens xiamenensis]